MKAWIEQFERDLTRAQMTESNLQDKYQVTYGKEISIFQNPFMNKIHMSFNLFNLSRAINKKIFKEVMCVILSLHVV